MRFMVCGAVAAAIALSAACAHGAPRQAAAPSLDAALSNADVAAVRQIAANPRRPRSERALAEGAVDYWQLQDDDAGPLLERAAYDQTLSANLRRDAFTLLSGLRLRQTRYADALTALDAALPGETDPAIHADLEQTRTFLEPLVGAPRMEARVGGAGAVTLTRDATSHMRAQVGVNDGTLDVIVDTGSGASTISLSNARRLGLHMLSGQASVGTATSASVTTELAVADTVTVGDAEFRNVVFLVLPDEALTFADGAYVVHGIIGLPLLMPLGRLEFTKTGDGATEILSYTPGPQRPAPNANLIADGVQAVALAHANNNPRTLNFFIDNGAPHSHVNRRFAAELPEIIATGHHEAVTTTGGAGSETQQDAIRLPGLSLQIGDGAAQLTDVPVIDDRQAYYHGDIGLDALEAGLGYVLDFNSMRIELLH